MSPPDHDGRDFRELRFGTNVRGRSGAIRSPVPFQNKGDAQMRSVLRVLFALALVVALTVITGPSASAASARGAEAQSLASGGKGSGDVQLTYTKWFAPAYPTMQGVVRGDIEGTFGVAVLTRTGLPPVGLLGAPSEIIAKNPSHSFTAMNPGCPQRPTALAVPEGTRTQRWRT